MKSAMFASALVVTSADWKEFKSKYGKVYNGLDHEAEHRQVYEATMAANAAHNALNLSWTQGENQFSDLTQQQYRVAAGLDHEAPENRMGSSPYLGEHVHDGSELPASVNWVTAGAVTPVKDQGACGSCWIFSTTGSTEGAWQIATGSLQSLSEQQFLDCLPNWPIDLCKGGMLEWAIDWATSTDLATEGSYPSYQAYRQEHCQSSFTTAIPQGSITGYKSVEPGSITGLQSAIQQQPVSITIEAENDAFRSYSSGILSSCGGERRHRVLAVGYGTESGQDYWLVKNSWGTSWGDNGFVKILLWACGVISEPLYPQVSTLITV